MGRSNPQTHAKRQREQAKREKRRAKEERRAARKAEKESANAADPTTDSTSTEGQTDESSNEVGAIATAPDQVDSPEVTN